MVQAFAMAKHVKRLGVARFRGSGQLGSYLSQGPLF